MTANSIGVQYKQERSNIVMEGEGQMKNERKSILLQMILSLTAVSFIVIPAFSAFVEGDLREFLTNRICSVMQ